MLRKKRAERALSDQLLSGAQVSGAPEDLARAAAALSELRARPAAGPSRADDTLAAMAEILTGDAPARRGVALRRPAWLGLGPRIATAGLAAMLAGSTSLAFTGSLPGPAQDAAHSVLSRVGVNVPRAHHSPEPGSTKGSEISDIAHSTSPDDRGKGDEVSDKASDGRSRAGDDHGTSEENRGSGRGSDERETNDRSGDHRPSPTPSASPSDDGDDGNGGD